MTTKNVWNYVHIDPSLVERNRFVHPTTPPLPPPLPPGGSSGLQGSYILMPSTSTYALGVDALRDACTKETGCPHPDFTLSNGSKIYRPLTFKENIEARVKDYETTKHPDGQTKTEEERLALFARWLDSCTGIAYQAKTTKFRVIPICSPLITIDKANNDPFLDLPYTSFLQGVELDSSSRTVKYNAGLSQMEVPNHPGWRAAVDDDASLLRTYAAIVFPKLKTKFNIDTGMGFYVRQNTDTDELRALCVNDLDNDSYAGGSNILNYDGSFLRVAPSSSQKK